MYSKFIEIWNIIANKETRWRPAPPPLRDLQAKGKQLFLAAFPSSAMSSLLAGAVSPPVSPMKNENGLFLPFNYSWTEPSGIHRKNPQVSRSFSALVISSLAILLPRYLLPFFGWIQIPVLPLQPSIFIFLLILHHFRPPLLLLLLRSDVSFDFLGLSPLLGGIWWGWIWTGNR